MDSNVRDLISIAALTGTITYLIYLYTKGGLNMKNIFKKETEQEIADRKAAQLREMETNQISVSQKTDAPAEAKEEEKEGRIITIGDISYGEKMMIDDLSDIKGLLQGIHSIQAQQLALLEKLSKG